MTVVSFRDADVLINGSPTYAGRTFEGQRIAGLLFNVRAVQAIFDDSCPATRQHWAYPDTRSWDPARNTDELCAALPAWREHGVLGLTINLQGGGPTYTGDVYPHYANNAFTARGALKPDYAARLAQVLARADELGMVVIVGLFYWTQMLRMAGEAALWRAAHEALIFLEASGHRNLLIELVNEVEVVVKNTPYGPLFGWERTTDTLLALRDRYPRLLYSTSGAGLDLDRGVGLPPPEFIAAADYVLLHGNGARPPDIARAVAWVRDLPAYQACLKPIIFNEDSPATDNLDAAWRAGASWGYYDQGWAGQGIDPYEDYAPRPRGNDGPCQGLTGFQTPPVNWTINSPFKRRFFQRVAQITGAPAAEETL